MSLCLLCWRTSGEADKCLQHAGHLEPLVEGTAYRLKQQVVQTVGMTAWLKWWAKTEKKFVGPRPSLGSLSNTSKRITHEDLLLLQTGDNEMTITLSKCGISALTIGERYICLVLEIEFSLDTLTHSKDILSEELTTPSGSKHLSGGTPEFIYWRFI